MFNKFKNCRNGSENLNAQCCSSDMPTLTPVSIYQRV